MDGKRLITSFFLANAIDSAITSLMLTQPGWSELNGFAAAFIQRGDFHTVLILKIAFTAALIGCYALACCLGSRLAYPLEKTLQVGTVVVWAVQIWNVANVMGWLFLVTT